MSVGSKVLAATGCEVRPDQRLYRMTWQHGAMVLRQGGLPPFHPGPLEKFTFLYPTLGLSFDEFS